MGLSLKLLGGFEVRDETGKTLSLPTRKTRALLAYLAVNADRPQLRDRLMTLLWGDRGEQQARHSLNQALMSIRRLSNAAGVTPLDGDVERVTLLSDAFEIDVADFRDRIDTDPEGAAALYHGPFLDGLTIPDRAFEEWQTATRSELQDIACDALSCAADRATDEGDTARAVDILRRLVALDPLREDAHRRLMKLLHANGDRAGAMRQYQFCTDILKKQLQVEPDSATKALFEELKKSPSIRSSVLGPELAAVKTEIDSSPLRPDIPSIAVLPFTNLSADPDQEFFADGTTEDIITGLSRFPSLFVISRNSSFYYKGQDVPIATVASELAVRYLLEGSVRKVGGRIRISAQLIDAESGNHLWAERYDRNLEDIFAIQDEVTDAIVAAVAPEVGHAERKRALRRPTDSLDAWGYYQRGLVAFYKPMPESLRTAVGLFDQAIELDPTFAMAFAMAAESRCRLTRQDMSSDKAVLTLQALDMSREAVALEPRDPFCLAAHGHVLSHAGQHQAAIAALRDAVALNPYDVMAHHWLGRALMYGGHPAEAIVQFDLALRLSPHDPHSAAIHINRGLALAALGRHEETVEEERLATEAPNPPFWAFVLLAGGLRKLGRGADADIALAEARKRSPEFSVKQGAEATRSFNPEIVKTIVELLRLAGIPEE